MWDKFQRQTGSAAQGAGRVILHFSALCTDKQFLIAKFRIV